ncbi:MAG: S-layer homology domain-containing protein [Clostridia bacterium]|nr:S-layer homology domain-containing protein [Clostridia bacterium]
MKKFSFRTFALALALIYSFGLVSFANVSETDNENIEISFESETDQTPPLGHRVLNYNFVDNDITMTDEELFGKYNYETQSWDIESKFDYDSFPNMAEVKKAAMEASSDGDYAKAKEEFKKYYQEKKRSFNIKAPQDSPSDDLSAKLHSEQMYYGQGTTLLDIASIENDYTTIEVDVTDRVDSVKATDTKNLAIVVMGLRKDGSSAEFDSREAGANGPKVEVRLATGATFTFSAEKDTYVSAGDNREKSYGTETVLKAEESVTSIGVTERVDTNTKRTSIVFHLDGLSEEDSVVSATLKLRGKNAAGTGKMYLALFSTSTANWTEETTWVNYPNGHIAFSYYGEDYQLNHSVLSKNADIYPNANFRYTEDICRTMFYTPFYNRYYYTKDEFYAQAYVKTVGDFMLQHKGGAAVNKTLDLANRKGFATQLPVIIDSPYATPEWVAALAKHVWGAADYMKTRFSSGSNWGTAEASQLYAIGAYFPEFKDAYDWTTNLNTAGNLKSAAYRVKYLLDNNIREDFSCYEHAGAYVNYFVSTITSIISIGEVTGVPFVLDAESEEKLINVMKYLADISGPGFTFTQWGDEGNYTGKHAQLATVGRRYNDSYLLYAGTDGKEGEKPAYTSVFYPTGKMAAMRTGWDSRSYMLFTDFGGRSVHGHNDDLGIIVFAKGKYLLSDQSMADYNSENDVILQQLEAHNVVITDGQEQLSKTSDSEEKTGAVSGKTNDWVTNENFDFLSGTIKDTGANSWTRNIMFVRGKYWIVTDYMLPSDLTKDTEHRQLWHMLSTANLSFDNETKALRSNFEDVNIQVVPLAPQNLSTNILTGLQGGNGIKDANYGVYTKTARGATAFNTLLRPESASENADVSITEIPLGDVTSDAANAMKINIAATDGIIRNETEAIYYIVNDEAQIKQRRIDDLNYDGKMFLYETDKSSNYQTLNIYKGSSLSTSNGKVLFEYSDFLNDFAVDYSGESIYMSGSLPKTSINWAELTFAKQGNIRAVYYNGESVSFKQTQNYIYFGDTPVIRDASQTEQEVQKPGSSKPTHGTSGGGFSGGGSVGGGAVVTPPAQGTQTGSKPALTSDNSVSYINGYDNGAIRPDAPITREEAVTALYRLVSNKTLTDTSEIGFSDVSKDDFSYEAINYMYKNKIISGYEDGSFKPKNHITRGEFAKIISAFTQKGNNLGNCPYTDISSSWAAEYIQIAYANGLIKGYTDGTFRPDNNITRAEFMVIVNRALNRSVTDDYAKEYNGYFTDVSSDHWAFNHIIAAVMGQKEQVN